MIDVGMVQGSAAQAIPLVVGKDTVYVHTDITPVMEDREGNPVEGLFSYHEIQYEKDEYIKLLAEQKATLDGQVTDLQIAICELYEGMVI